MLKDSGATDGGESPNIKYIGNESLAIQQGKRCNFLAHAARCTMLSDNGRLAI